MARVQSGVSQSVFLGPLTPELSGGGGGGWERAPHIRILASSPGSHAHLAPPGASRSRAWTLSQPAEATGRPRTLRRT